MRFVSTAFLILSCFWVSSTNLNAGTQSISLAWDGNSDANVVGYVVYMGTVSGYYPIANNVGQATNATVAGLQPGGTYYFVVTAYTVSGLESAPSEEIVYQAPGMAPQLQISAVGSTVSVKFVATSGKTYVVEYKNSLDEPQWTLLNSVAGTDGVMAISDSSSGAVSRFYRVGVQ